MADARANFATSTVATAPSPANSGTSLVVAAGEGARFPTVPFNAVISPVDALATPANSEIVRVTAKSTDTLTITRTQESSSARTVVVGDRIYWGLTKKHFDDIDTAIAAVDAKVPDPLPDMADTGDDSKVARWNDATNSYDKVAVYSQAEIVFALTVYQDKDATLTGLAAAGAPVAANKFLYTTGNDTFAAGDITSTGRALIDDASVDAQRDTLQVPARDNVDGFYAPQSPGLTNNSTVWPTANRAYFHRFMAYESITAAGMAFCVTNLATANDAIDVGIYSWSGSTLTRIASSGATTGLVNGTTGVKYQTFTSTVALTGGTSYYAAMSYGTIGGTAASLIFATGTAGSGAFFGASLGKADALLRASSHALGTSYNTTLDYNWGNGPMLAVRSS